MPKLDRTHYGKSEHGNFEVVDTIPVPHPYMIMPRHIEIAADRFGGILGEAAIEAAEKRGVGCGICKGHLKYKEHETALLIECRKPLTVDTDNSGAEGRVNPELHAYLLQCKEQAEADGFAGFAFKEAH